MCHASGKRVLMHEGRVWETPPRTHITRGISLWRGCNSNTHNFVNQCVARLSHLIKRRGNLGP